MGKEYQLARTKTPFLSLGATGSVGGSITTQKRGSATLVRSKPTPAYRWTLPQAYQRWLYEDYAYLWTLQSQATRQSYATGGAKVHLTGFQYWMKYQLTNLPDILGLWHLDRGETVTAIDFSKKGNHGVIIGASPTVGLINGCLSFDGLNDYVDMAYIGSLPTTFSFECFFKVDSILGGDGIFAYRTAVPTAFSLYRSLTDLILYVRDDAGLLGIATLVGVLNTTDWFFAYGERVGNNIALSINAGVPATDTKAFGATTYTDMRLLLAAYWSGVAPAALLAGTLDHPVIYNRALDITELKRHSERRYPA